MIKLLNYAFNNKLTIIVDKIIEMNDTDYNNLAVIDNLHDFSKDNIDYNS